MALKLKRNLLLAILMNSLVITLSGQNFTIRNYTTREGLPHNNVRTIARDSTGYLWIGTWDGLSRFDGYEFKNYYHDVTDTTSLPFFSIYNIVIDRDNTLWILTDHRQLIKYNRETDNFSVIKNIEGISTEQIINFDIDLEGKILIINKNEIFLKAREPGRFNTFHLKNKDGMPFHIDLLFSSVITADTSKLWLVGSRVMEFRKTNDSVYIFEREYPINKITPAKTIDYDYTEWYRLYTSPSGKKWIFSNTGLFFLDRAAGVFREYKSGIPEGEFTGRVFYWGWKNEGIYIFNAASGKLSVIPGKIAKQPFAVYPDGINSVWFSNTTTSGVALGLNHLIYTPGYFKNYLFTDPDSTLPAVYSVVMDKYRRIWTGIRGYDHIVLTDTNNRVTSIGKLPVELFNKSGHIRSFLPGPDGIWIGYFSMLLRYFDYASGSFTNYFPDERTFRAIALNKNGKILIGESGLSIFDPETGITEKLWTDPSPLNVFKLNIVSDSIVYAGISWSKIVKYNLTEKKSIVISLPGGICNTEDVIPGKENDLWIAFLGNGVCRYDQKSGKSIFYTTAQGLSNNTTYNLLKDRSGNIWVSTNEGISRINPETGLIRRFGRTDGLEISEFNSGAKYVTDDGEFIFGGMGGFVRFYPDSIRDREEEVSHQRIILTRFEVSGDVKRLPEPLDESDTIYLRKGEDNFHLSFSTTDFINVNKTFFRYRLSNVNQDWIETGPNNRNINYSHISPGWYNLEIQATDATSHWKISKTIVFRLKPYFYESMLFIITAPLLIIAIIIFSVVTYIRQIKQKSRQVQDELKLQSLRGQMNPHFIFNSLNSINYFISNNDKISANSYIADFSRLIRAILSNLGNEYVSIDNELNTLRDYLKIEHLRFGDKFDYEIDTDNLRISRDTEVFPGLVQPFVENAIWHGVRLLENRKGFIRIKFSNTDPHRIRCVVEDNGVGRTFSSKSRTMNGDHKSRGISIVIERLQLISKVRGINYELVIEDLYPDIAESGTRVWIDIPVR